MKKFFISALVIVSFVVYSWYQRVYGTAAQQILTPQVQPSPTQVPLTSLPTAVPPTALPTVASKKSVTLMPTPTDTPSPTPKPKTNSIYKDGTYSGDPADAFYGTIQVAVTISGGRITNVQFLQYPNDRGTSVYINSQADPILAQEAIQSQSAQVDIVSGATDSSMAFIQSMQSALSRAKS